MKVKLLGTGAAEGIPALFCDCRICRIARERGGNEVRLRCSALVDDCIKIDLGPDTLAQVQKFRLNPTLWKHVIFTHSHDDHFAVRELQYLLPPFTTGKDIPFDLTGNETIVHRIAGELEGGEVLKCNRLASFETLELSRYRVTSIRSMHLDEEDSLNLLIDDGKHRFLYAVDTGWWPEVTWNYLAHLDRPLDLLVIDTSHGARGNGYTGHLGIEAVLKLRELLLKSGALTDRSKLVTTHHCHNGDLTHEELVARLSPEGIEVGFDGWEAIL